MITREPNAPALLGVCANDPDTSHLATALMKMKPISEPLPPASSSAVLASASPGGVAAGVHFSGLRSEGAAAKSRSARPPLAVVYGGGESRLMAESHQRESVAEPLTASASRTASDLAAVPLLLTPKEAARHYRVCLRTVRYWIARRRLRVHQPAGKGGKVLIWRDA